HRIAQVEPARSVANSKYRGHDKRRPTGEERHASERRDGAEEGDAARRQHVKAPGEERDSGTEAPARCTNPPAVETGREESDQNDRDRVVHLVAYGRLEYRQHVG